MTFLLKILGQRRCTKLCSKLLSLSDCSVGLLFIKLNEGGNGLSFSLLGDDALCQRPLVPVLRLRR